MQRDRLPYLIIPLAAFLAIVPLLKNGCSCGHDFDFHLLNWLEAARQFTHGNLHPHWAYTPAYNAGEPRFVFYPPLSWHLGAILGLLFPWTWTPIAYTWLSLTAAGLALHRLARDFTTPTAALIAAVLYTVNPYMLFTAYERTAYAELLAAAFIPLLLKAILREQVTIPRIAIPVALLWLTNAPAAVMSCYALALLTLIRLATNSSNRTPPAASNNGIATNSGTPYLDSEIWASRESATAPAHLNPTTALSQTPLQLTRNTIAGTGLGLGLAAFYILPAADQRRYVQIAMAIIPDMRIQDNFLFHHTRDVLHDQVLHTASLIALAMIAATATILLTLFLSNKARVPHPLQSRRKPGPPASAFARWGGEGWDVQIPPTVLLPLTILTITIALLLTPLTSPIWTHVPELAFLQFPWRLTAILAAILALTIAIALRPLNLKPVTTATLTLVTAAALTCPAYYLFHQSCDQEDTVQARLTLFQSNRGTEPTDEYTPITADNDSLAPTNPPYWLSPDPNAKAPANTTLGPAPTHLTANPPTPEDLILNLRDYPSWSITRNGTPITNHLQRDDGLIALPIPAGPSTIDIHYAQTMDQTVGDILSLASLGLLLFFLLRIDNQIPPT
ncbi:MAG TPA: 6-pyruvoyl-tetrahydropterin synthase-related protein [Edaphobacter sp.]|nr:6-pyruvoyl-tetrahydropterin synthase-related protein [Edaphobacter sp.]